MKTASRMSAIAFAVLAIASSAAMAGNGTGFYVGGGLGYAGHQTYCEGVQDCSTSRLGFKALAGYQIMPNLAIESSLGDTGRTRASGNGATLMNKTQSFTIATLGIYPVSKEVDLFGKLGMHRTKNKIEGNAFNLATSFSRNTSGLLAGIGAQYRFTPNLIGRVEYEYLNRAVYDLEGRKAINLVTASVLYQF